MIQPLVWYFPAKGIIPTGHLFFIPGLWCQSKIWNNWIDIFTKSGFACYTIDLSPKQGDTSIQDYVHLVEQALDHVQHKTGVSPIVIAHSMGGLIAQTIASQRYATDRNIPALVLLNSVAPRGICNLQKPLLCRCWKYLSSIMGNKTFKPTTKDLLTLVFNNVGGENLNRLDELVPDSGRVAREIMLGSISVSEYLMPKMLVLAGKQDQLIPTSVQKHLKKKYGYACTYKEIDSGHMTMLEHGSQFIISAIIEWLYDKSVITEERA